MEWNVASWIFVGLFGARLALELGLDALQLRYLVRRGDRVPSHLEGQVDPATIGKAVRYNRDRLRLAIAGRIYEAVPIFALILFGFALIDDCASGLGFGALPTGLVFLAVIGAIGALWSLPLELISIFGVEARYGFNRQSLGGFVVDKIKGLALAVVIGGSLAAVVLLIIGLGGLWWLYAFGAVAVIQLVIAWIYPLLIMPLFNRLEPVEEGLARDVADLARQVGFPLAGVMSMDGSKRTAHVNAFITGLKGARRIVLYDTLCAKLDRRGLLAVLAHELGHFKLGHIRRRLFLVIGGLLALFALFGWVEAVPEVYSGLGFRRASAHAALVIFGLYVSEGLFPVSFLLRRLSRRNELAADRFAVDATGGGADLTRALIALVKQNLSSPGSHPWYRGYRNTHPALRERLEAIRDHCRAFGLPVESDHAQVDPSVAPEAEHGEDDRAGQNAADTDLAHGQTDVDPPPPDGEGDAGQDDEQQ
jgi:STE24 endopeptidase